VAEVALLGAVLFCVSGFARGQEPDQLGAELFKWGREWTRTALAAGWLHPALADAAVVLLSFLGLASVMFGLAALVRRIPAFVGFMVLAEFHRRQGHKLSGAELLLGITVPMALTAALAAKSTLSIYACAYFLVAYGYIRVSTEPATLESILNWFVRIRTGVDTVVDEPDEHDGDEAA
jgi:hypothetical protein